jgi:hypothetical protein
VQASAAALHTARRMTRSEWIVGSVGRALAAAIVGYLIVWPFAGDEYTVGEYFVVLLYGAVAFPVYLFAVSRVSDRRRFRLWAIGLALILALPFGIGSLFFFVPEIGAAELCYLLIGLTIERGPRTVPEHS